MSDVDARVQPEFARQLVAETYAPATDVLRGCKCALVCPRRAGAAKSDDAPAAEELPTRLHFDRGLVEIDRQFGMLIEGGLGRRMSILAGIGYRF
ncbi:MAG TPA: hypothetical protein VFJ68_02975 [Casimicrobiaceae bacterium]|nr:hypothetical protein [Casimicrobiaceae bacterium]